MMSFNTSRWFIALSATLCALACSSTGGDQAGVGIAKSALGSPATQNIVAQYGAANQIGQLTHAGNGMYRTFNVYDAQGRATHTQHVMDDWSYTYATTYGYPQGQGVSGAGTVVTHQTFPDGEHVDYTYDAGDQQQQITTTPAGGSPQPVVKSVLRNARGQITQVTYGNDVSQFHTYNDASDLRLHQISTGTNGNLQSYTYTYDANGNLTSLTDGADSSQSITNLTYDSLNQLTGGQTPQDGKPFRNDVRLRPCVTAAGMAGG
jgi:YD repeat-containing protein